MRIKISENSINRDELMTKLSEKFETKYKISPRKKAVIVIAKNKITGCVILVRKKSLIINGNFSNITAQIIFVVLMILLGVLLPILIYFIFFFSKMKKVEKEIVQFIKQEYKSKII